MASIPDSSRDAFLNLIADNATHVTACETEPANYAGLAAAVELGEYTLTVGDGNGDYVIADGDTSGRKLSLTAQAGTAATGTGSAAYLAFHDNSAVLYATSTIASPASLVNTEEFLITAFDIVEIRDAT